MQISLTHLREVWRAKPLSSQLTTLALITAGSGTRDYQVKRADSEPLPSAADVDSRGASR